MSQSKKSMVGLEIELFTLDNEGALKNWADRIFKAIERKKISSYVRSEISKSMVEMGAAPKKTVSECALYFLDNLQELIEIAEKLGIVLLPLGVHPGSGIPELRSTIWYNAKKKLLGLDNMRKAGEVCGFHFHYTLPRGIVSRYTKMIRTLKRSSAKDVFLNQYNFLIATDPAIITFCQSSPFWFGRHYAKDCRVLIYRDFEVVKNAEHIRGIHYYFPPFGSLPRYEFTLQDLRVMADQRKAEWLRMLELKRFHTNEIAGFPVLKFMWGPLRVNKIGTIEYRGSDMNFPSYIFSASALLKYLLMAIAEKELEVIPSDIGTTEPFELEGDMIYVPPYATVRYLEYQSTVNGLEVDDVYTYCSRLLKLLQKISDKSNSAFLERIKKILESKKTMADIMINFVKKNGYDVDEKLPDDVMNYMALYYADKLKEDIEYTKKIAFKDGGGYDKD